MAWIGTTYLGVLILILAALVRYTPNYYTDDEREGFLILAILWPIVLPILICLIAGAVTLVAIVWLGENFFEGIRKKNQGGKS